MKLLLVEDDEMIAMTLAQVLTNYDYTVDRAADGEIAWEMVTRYQYDLILLDIIIPKLDGVSLCRQLRFSGYQMPILLLTVLDSTPDRVNGLEAGADDYVIKPFNMPELLARIKALLRRGKVTLPQAILTWEDLKLNPDTGEVFYQENILHLTPKEYHLLELFLRNPGRIFSRSIILDRLWSMDESPGEEAVTTHIKNIRQKIKSAGMTTDLIETVYGLGYRLRKAPTNEIEMRLSALEGSLSTAENSHLLSPNQDQIRQSQWIEHLRNLRQKYQESLQEKVTIFAQTLIQLQSGSLEETWRKKTEINIHQLAGSLGVFGFMEASNFAQDIENIFQHNPNLLAGEIKLFQGFIEEIKQIIHQSTSSLSQSITIPEPLEINRVIVSPRLFIIDDDPILRDRVQREAISWGFQVETTPDIKTGRHAIEKNHPDIILLDLSFPETHENGIVLLREVHQKQPEIPIFVWSSNNELSERLEVARLGAKAFLNKSIPIIEMLKIMTQTLNQTPENARILVVDDDPNQLSLLRVLLEPWGFQITTLADPQRFWEILEITNPDILILDIEMPCFNGIELCQVVRNDVRWTNLPILFLSCHSDSETIHQVFSVGADDYVNKPIIGPELIARILNRLERSQLRKKLGKRPT
jgi:DNA-binding response OmpR family regulator/HPt (histidine-containing phosphotransfer) domain-containing protein